MASTGGAGTSKPDTSSSNETGRDSLPNDNYFKAYQKIRREAKLLKESNERIMACVIKMDEQIMKINKNKAVAMAQIEENNKRMEEIEGALNVLKETADKK